MKYAVIKSGGKQYRVSEGDLIDLDKLSESNEKKLIFDKVLLLVSEGNINIGKPLVTGAKVVGNLIENLKGKKIRVSKFKSKVRYRKVIGFRPLISKVKIEKIEEKSSKLASKIK